MYMISLGVLSQNAKPLQSTAPWSSRKTPSRRKIRLQFGAMLMAAPISFASRDCSKTVMW